MTLGHLTMMMFLFFKRLICDGVVIGWRENTFGDEGHPDFNLDLKLSRVFLNKRVN